MNGVKIAFLNIVSLKRYRNVLNVILYENDIGIIGLSEKRLEKRTEDHKLSIDGYKIFRNHRDSNGNGVTICVKGSFSVPTIKLKTDKMVLHS